MLCLLLSQFRDPLLHLGGGRTATGLTIQIQQLLTLPYYDSVHKPCHKLGQREPKDLVNAYMSIDQFLGDSFFIILSLCQR